MPALNDEGEVRERTGVLAVADVTVLESRLLLGVVMLIVKISPVFEGGIVTVKAVGVAEKMEGWIIAPF